MAIPDSSTVKLVYDQLEHLDSLDRLNKLFSSTLNYDFSGESLPIGDVRGLATPIDDFRVVGRHGDFHILYCRFGKDPSGKDQLRISDERTLVTRWLRDYPYSLFVFSTADQQRWHFVNVKLAVGREDEANAAPGRRRMFRRITVGPEERLRTASERISLLDSESIPRDLFGLSALAVQERHDEAFDVEAVTKDFFREYRRVFELVERLVQGFDEPGRKRLFTQKLFNRLMFIAFIQKKGWLKLGPNTDYLNALWHAYHQSKESDGNFYRDRLQVLFTTALNTSHEIDVVGINKEGFLGTVVGDVPYLNGGLFEEDEDDRNPNIVVLDRCIDTILHELFDRFNFTVTESTPLDVEVAVDPEMLGRVFEELVTGRHETGSYYTPKPVVSFMCREALKGYLQTNLPDEDGNSVEKFVEDHESTGLHNPEAALDALRRVRVCDPACGSGAYLLGMLHELLDLRACLFTTRNLDPISAYQRKLDIIQGNVYGVDSDQFAVNIARLRLWLSLAVEFEGANPPPLPNLDYKIEVGDSLTAPDPSGGVQPDMFRQKQIQDYLHLKEAYLMAHGSEKAGLRSQIDALRAEIAEWAHPNDGQAGFDWPVEYAEVMGSGGFDIIVANPPYVRADAQFKHLLPDEDTRQAAIAKWKDYRKTLVASKTYGTLYEKWDLYIPFLERAHQLLRGEGEMVFIISDAYNAAKYARRSHEFFLKHSCVKRIDFCSDTPLFRAGVYNTIVHFLKGSCASNHEPVRIRRWGEKPEDFNANTEVLPTVHQAEATISIFKPSGEPASSTLTGAIPLDKVCYISKGMVIHADERSHPNEFTSDDLLVDQPDETHPKRLVLGKDIAKWWLRRVRYLEWGTARAPGRFSRPTFPELHEAKEKLLAVRMCGETPRVVYDERQLYSNHTVIIFCPWHFLSGVRNKSIQKTAKYRDEVTLGGMLSSAFREDMENMSRQFSPKYLLGVLNSTFAREFVNRGRRSKLDIYPDDWKGLPIVSASPERQKEVVLLVDSILAEFENSGYPLLPDAEKRVGELEHKIDELVEALYSDRGEQ